MNSLEKSYFVLIAFLKIVGAQVGFNEFVTLVEDVQRFYLSSSIFIVYDKHQFGFKEEKWLLNAIKEHSRQYSMSQAITYDRLSRRVSSHRENVLHSFPIFNAENLQCAINATKNADMSLHPWLLIFSKNVDFDCNKPGKNFFKLRMDTKMTAKCEKNNILKKYYSVIENETEVTDLAEWTPEKKLEFKDSKTLHEVETDMKGIMLKLARRDHNIEERNEPVTDFLSKLMSELEKLGNFKTEVTVRDASMGYYDEKSKRFNGLTSLVYENKADIGLVLFSMSNSRLKAVDFPTPIARAHYYLFAKLPESKGVHWTAYFEAFDLYTWIAVLLSNLIVAIILTLMKRERRGNFVNSFFGNFVNIWGFYCQQGPSDRPSNTPIQIIYFSILFSSLILNAIYSAIFTSYITLLSPTLPFSTYEEFKLDTSYDVTVQKNSRDEAVISHHEYLKPLESRLKISCERPVDPYEGFQQACESKTVFYSNDVLFDGIKYSPPCQLGRLDMNRVEYDSLILTKNSPYTKAISYFIARLRDHGILKRLKNTYFYEYTEIPENRPNIISFEEILPILTVWIIGVAVSLIVWLFELIMFYLPSF